VLHDFRNRLLASLGFMKPGGRAFYNKRGRCPLCADFVAKVLGGFVSGDCVVLMRFAVEADDDGAA